MNRRNADFLDDTNSSTTPANMEEGEANANAHESPQRQHRQTEAQAPSTPNDNSTISSRSSIWDWAASSWARRASASIFPVTADARVEERQQQQQQQSNKRRSRRRNGGGVNHAGHNNSGDMPQLNWSPPPQEINATRTRHHINSSSSSIPPIEVHAEVASEREAVNAIPVVVKPQDDLNNGCSLICECCKLNVDTTTAKGRFMLYGTILLVVGLLTVGVVMLSTMSTTKPKKSYACSDSCFPELDNSQGIIYTADDLCECYCYMAQDDHEYLSICEDGGSSSTSTNPSDPDSDDGGSKNDDLILEEGGYYDDVDDVDDGYDDDFYDDAVEDGPCPIFCYERELSSKWKPDSCSRFCYNSYYDFRRRYNEYLDSTEASNIFTP